MILGFCDDMGRSFCSACRPEPPSGADIVHAENSAAEDISCERCRRILASLRPTKTALPLVVHQADVEHAMGQRVRLSFSIKVY